MKCFVFTAMLLAWPAGALFAQGVQPAPGPARDPVLAEAERALADRLPTVAMEKLREALANPALDPATRAEAGRDLTEAMLRSGDAEGALARLDFPATPHERFWKAEALSTLGRWAEAEPVYEEVAQENPEHREAATLGAAEALHLQGRTDDAIALLEQMNSPSNLVRLRLAELYLGQKRLKPAQKLLQGVAPSDALETKWRQLVQGRLYLAQDQPAAAMENFDALLKDPHGLTPELEAGATVGTANARIVLNGLEVADNVLENYIWRRPDSPYLEDMFRRLDAIYAGEDDASESELLHWAKLEPARRAALARYYAARLQQRQNRLEKAIGSYTDFAQKNPQHPLACDAYMQLGQLYLETNRLPAAVTAFEGAMRQSQNADDRARAEAATGDTYFAQGEYLLAALTFTDSAQRSPAVWLQGTYNAALAWLNLNPPNYGKFLEDYRALSARYPDSEQRRELLLEEGLLQARTRDPNAQATLESFIHDFPDNRNIPAARLALAELAFENGDADRTSDLLRVAYDALTPKDAAAPKQSTEQADCLALFAADAVQPRDDDKVIALGLKFLSDHPDSALKPQVRMKLGQVYFRREDFANAQTQFQTLTEESPADPLADKALILAGESAVRSMNTDGPEEALELFGRVAKGAGPLRLYARQEQAILEARLGKYKDAVIVYDDILRSKPDADLRMAALCGKADCLVAAGAPAETTGTAAAPASPNATPDSPIALYDQVAADPDATATWRDQALYKKAKWLANQGHADAALAALYDVLTAHAAASGKPEPDFFWFEKAGFDAAAMLEGKSDWKGAISILDKVAQAAGPGSDEAKTRAEQIRLEHFVWD